MQGKFIYVFNTDTRDKLLSLNYLLLKADNNKGVFIFENNNTNNTLIFSENDMEDFEFALSDTLTF